MSQQKAEELFERFSRVGYHRARVSNLSNFDKLIGGITWAISLIEPESKGTVAFREDEPGTPAKTTIQKKIVVIQIMKILEKWGDSCKVTIQDLYQVKAENLESLFKMIMGKLAWLETIEYKIRNSPFAMCLDPAKDERAVEIRVTDAMDLFCNSSRDLDSPKMIEFDVKSCREEKSGKEILQKYVNYASSADPIKAPKVITTNPYIDKLSAEIENLKVAQIFADIEDQALPLIRTIIEEQFEINKLSKALADCNFERDSIIEIDPDRLANTVQLMNNRVDRLMKLFENNVKLARLQEGKEEEIDKIEFDQILCGMLSQRLNATNKEFVKTHNECVQYESYEKEPSDEEPRDLRLLNDKNYELYFVIDNIKKRIEKYEPKDRSQENMKYYKAFKSCIDDIHWSILDFTDKIGAMDFNYQYSLSILEEQRNQLAESQKKLSFALEELEIFKKVHTAIAMLRYQLPVWEKEVRDQAAGSSKEDVVHISHSESNA